MPHRTFTLDEVADYLHLDPADVRLLVKRKEIPHEPMGTQFRFRQVEIDRWASQRLLDMDQDDIRAFHVKSSAKRHDLSLRHELIPELMRPSHIEPALQGKTRAKIIRNMVDLADKTGLLIYKDDLLSGIEERENMNSTAMAGGIALLHTPHHDPYMFEDSFIVLGRALAPIPFGGSGGATTDLFFMVCSQEDRIHLHLLARLSMICCHTDVLLHLHESKSAVEMYEAMVAGEDEIIKRHTGT